MVDPFNGGLKTSKKRPQLVVSSMWRSCNNAPRYMLQPDEGSGPEPKCVVLLKVPLHPVRWHFLRTAAPVFPFFLLLDI